MLSRHDEVCLETDHLDVDNVETRTKKIIDLEEEEEPANEDDRALIIIIGDGEDEIRRFMSSQFEEL